MQVAVLGPVRLVRGGAAVDLGTPKQRALLAALALRAGTSVSAGALVELLWGDGAPSAVSSSLQAYVAGLRRAVEPDRPARAPSTVLLTSPAGYRLVLGPEALDAARFAETAQRARRRLAQRSGELPLPPTGMPDSELAALEEDLRAALALWRGLPYADLRDADDVAAERARLAELRLIAQEDLALVRVGRGESATVAAELEALAREHPLREPLWGLWALALAVDGRQADALAALRQARERLADELGVDPGQALQSLETAVLRQDPRLRRVAAPVASGVSVGPAAAPGGPPRPAGGSGRERAGNRAAVPTLPAPRLPGPPAPDRRLVGRSDELAALDGVLTAALVAGPAAALLVGEPGIGKSRLLEEVAERAAARGFAVLAGRCSRDEGAPPMWPWTGVLRDLSAAVPLDRLDVELGLLASLISGGAEGVPTSDGPDARFRTGDAVTRALTAASVERPLLVLFDDLHWADSSSLRLLGQVLEDLPPQARVAVVVTRRATPQPFGPLAEVGESLVRRGARRLELAGLSTAEVADLVTVATARQPDADLASVIHDRTEGNALFVLELMRLGGHAGARDSVPAGVTDVVAARVARLPERAIDTLQSAAVLGRRFDLDLLAAVCDADEEDVLDRLDPALAAGVVLEDGVGRFRFSHALVADAVSAAVPVTRRARRHAAAAAALERGRGTAGSDRLAETARHWLSAGPRSAGRAWRTASRAAEQAARLFAHEEAAGLLAEALRAVTLDPEATAEDRFELLMRRADACKWSADRPGHGAAQHAAIAVARELGDVGRLARAATDAVDGVVWTPRAFGVVDQVALDALAEALARLPEKDGELRCRALVARAAELYYAPGRVEEREALAQEGLAMARRLGEPSLLSWACLVAGAALWRPARLRDRVELAREALRLTAGGPDVTREAYARAALSIALQEAGEVDEMWQAVEEATRLCERARLHFPLVVVGAQKVPWLALQGRLEEADELFARVSALMRRTAIPDQDESLAGALFVLELAKGRTAEMVPLLAQVEAATPMPMQVPLMTVMARAGRVDDARALYRQVGLPVGNDDWLRMLLLALAGEVALRLRLPDEAAQLYERLAPFAGRSSSGGSGAPVGPVDIYLASAAAAAGERELATRHADEAQRLCADWRLPVARTWLDELRELGGF
jgi:DNA-binding SARP family transcriptional activator